MRGNRPVLLDIAHVKGSYLNAVPLFSNVKGGLGGEFGLCQFVSGASHTNSAAQGEVVQKFYVCHALRIGHYQEDKTGTGL